MNLNPVSLSEYIISLYLLKKGVRVHGWLTAEEMFFKNYSINYFNDNIIDYDGNACGIIVITSIEITFENDHIHVLRYIPKQ